MFTTTDEQSWHRRIRQDGTIEDLENFNGEFGWPVYPDNPEQTRREHAVIRANNEKVLSILKAKGLLLNTENPDFERENVVRIEASPNG